MHQMNAVRNAANVYHLRYNGKNSKGLEFNYVERFKIDWSLFRGNLAEEAKAKFQLCVPNSNRMTVLMKFLSILYCSLPSVWFINKI